MTTVRVAAVQATPVTLDADLNAILSAKRWFDAVGHDSRRDVLLPGQREASGPADGGGGLPLHLLVDEP